MNFDCFKTCSTLDGRGPTGENLWPEDMRIQDLEEEIKLIVIILSLQLGKRNIITIINHLS